VREKAKRAGAAVADAATNARITATIKTKLLTEPGLSGLSINVDTTDGFVTLSGTVSSPEQVARAVKIALETEGVYKVASTLQVKSGP
jgi:hyperosmotically inducible protein